MKNKLNIDIIYETPETKPIYHIGELNIISHFNNINPEQNIKYILKGRWRIIFGEFYGIALAQKKTINNIST
jgi:hypothetical protein